MAADRMWPAIRVLNSAFLYGKLKPFVVREENLTTLRKFSANADSLVCI
jgi:hypothetical protein